MTGMADLRAVGSVARHLPGALVRRGCTSRLALGNRNERFPVVLVHGYVGSESVWATLRGALAHAGFGYVVSLNYSCFATEASAVADELSLQGRLALARTGAPRVHLIGHSMGGLLVRHVVNHRHLAESTAAAVTIASPHRGAPLARIAPGRCARIMQQRDFAEYRCAARPLRWLSYYSDHDRFVPSSSARLDDSHAEATNVLVPSCGHLTICHDRRLINSLVSELVRTEAVAEPRADLLGPVAA